MPSWMRLLTFTETGIKAIRQSPGRVFQEMDDLVRSHDCKITNAWVTLGDMDLVTVIDAPDEERLKVMEESLATKGIYTATTMPAIPIDEFLKMAATSGNFGMFLEAWMGQRRAALTSAVVPETGPKARTKKRARQTGIDERKTLRVALPSAAGGVVAFIDLAPPVKARITSIGCSGERGALSTRLSLADGARLKVADWAVGHEVALALELPDDPAKLPAKGKIVRVDDIGGKEFEVGLSYAGVGAAQAARLDRFFRKYVR